MRRLSFALAALCAVMLVAAAFAQDYPSKPITMIVPYAAGGSTDQAIRAIDRVWLKYAKQPLVIVNKPGGGGVVGGEFVVRAKPDGYTVLFGYGSGSESVMPHLQKLPYDPHKDLVPVARISVHSVVIETGANSQFKTLQDMVNWAKRENKPVTSAVSTKAGAVDIALNALAKAAGIKIVTVPGTGGADSVTMLAGGHVMIGGNHPSEMMPQVKAGRFRPLAIALPERDPSLPDIPTLKELGYNISTWGSIKGLAVPVGTPKEVITYLETTLKKVCEDAEFKKIMADLYQPIMYQDSKEFAKFMKEAFDDYGKLIKDLNITLQ